MIKLAKEDIAYIAGLFEGEGCITIAHGKNYSYPKVSISSNDLDVIEYVALVTGEGFVTTKKRANKKYPPAYCWDLHKEKEIWEFIDLIYSWLGERRRSRIDEIRKICFTSPRECNVCGTIFQPGIDRKRNAITCSNYCMERNRLIKSGDWHRRNDVRRRVLAAREGR